MRSAPLDVSFPSDRVLEGLARDVIKNASADDYLSDRHRAFAHALNERLRLARELHDGLLQALTGLTLQLESASRLVDADPHAALRQLREIQEMIVDRQRELREWIEGVRNPEQATRHREALATVLHTLC